MSEQLFPEIPSTGFPLGDTLAITAADLGAVMRLLRQAHGFARFGGQQASGAWISEAADLLATSVFLQCIACADPVEDGDDRCAFHREQDSLRRADADRDMVRDLEAAQGGF